MNGMGFLRLVSVDSFVAAIVIAGIAFALVWQKEGEEMSISQAHINTYLQTGALHAEQDAPPPPREPFQNVSEEEQKCLAQAIYFEARGEPVDGQQAIGDVVLNRVRSESYPDSVCGVVWQGVPRSGIPDRLFRCQFSFACDGLPETPHNGPAWKQAMEIAWVMLHTGMRGSLHDNVLYYHAEYVSPAWARAMFQVAQIGKHVFYTKERRRLDKTTPG